MSKFSSRSPPTAVVPRRMSREKYRTTILNLPGPVDKWLNANIDDEMEDDVFIRGFLAIDDIREDQVWCTVERAVLHVRELI